MSVATSSRCAAKDRYDSKRPVVLQENTRQHLSSLPLPFSSPSFSLSSFFESAEYKALGKITHQRGFLRVVSANSSLRRLILSFRPSASRLAAVIFACICSPL